MNFDQFLETIRDEKPLAFSRFGDGEWNCILSPNDAKGNCDGHKYFQSLSYKLRETIRLYHPTNNYYLGMQNFAIQRMGDRIQAYLQSINQHSIEWIDADVFHRASIKSRFKEFIDLVRTQNTIIVGPSYLRKLDCYSHFVEVPEKDCWLEKDRILTNVKEIMLTEQGKFVVLFSASMASNVMINDMVFFDQRQTYLDMGSVFDPYVGKSTRSYHKKLIEDLKNNQK